MKNFMKILKRIFIVPNTFEPDDLRRRQVLSNVLLFMVFLVVFMEIAEFWNDDLVLLIQRKNGPDSDDMFMAFIGMISVIAFSTLLLILNRSNRVPRNLVGWISIVGMLASISVGDSPHELTSGRSMFAWAVPITLSVIVLPPASVFVVDVLITVAFLYYAGFSWHHFQSYTLSEIYAVSFISWLGMSIAERAIRDARNESKKNAAILDSVADGVVVVGADNQVIRANPVAFELTDGDVSKVISAAENTEIGGRILSLRWSNIQGVGRVAIVRDISRQVEIEHAKEAVLGVVSHEMRTPLAAIMGHTEVLASTSLPNSDRLERIHANAQRMMTLVNDLLDQAHIEAGVLKMHNESFSPVALANAVRDTFCARAKEKQIALNIVVAESLPEYLIGDLHRYQQILGNLVDNAIKFTKEGGRVDILLAPGEDADKWQMVVSDTGIGIPPERLPDVFEPFRRASDYAKRSYQGAGLGLSIAKRIAQLAHGDIQVKSTVGQGSTFIVTLPIDGGAG